MRHLTASIVCAAALALGIAGFNHPVSAHENSGGTLASRIYSVATNQRVPDSARRIAGRLRSVMRPLQAAQSQPVVQPPTVWTDHGDYAPGAIVHIFGSGWQNNELVTLHFVESSTDPTLPLDTHPDLYATADEFGNFSNNEFSPDYHDVDVTFTLTATGQSGSAQTVFHDANPSANLDQCANDPTPSPSSDGCNTNASQWENGNLGASKSVYVEGDSIPYRLLLDNLALGTGHTVTIEWDTTKSSKHALDYLTTFNQSVLTAIPCLGVSPACGSATTFAIPADPQVTGAGVTPIAGNFTMFGGTITAVSAYSYSTGTGFAGDKSASITITFTATAANPVLAWGGHIATRKDWGLGSSAVAISGSPYHTRLLDLDGRGGNEDRSLSADAVIFPATIAIVKDATPNGSTSFGFTASPSPLANFSLVDDGTTANTKVFSNILTFTDYSVNESSIPSGWGFDSVSCSHTADNGGSYTTNTTTVTIALKEGEIWVCTYLDSERTGLLKVIKHVINDNGGTATASQWSLHVKSGANEVTGSPQAGQESPGTQYTLVGGTYNVSETGAPSAYTFDGFSGDCDSSGNVTVVAGQTKTCTLTNNDNAPSLKLIKHVVNDNGGIKVAGDWTLSAGAHSVTGSETAVEATNQAGTYALSESSVTGYTRTSLTCDDAPSTQVTSVTIGLGQTRTCTFVNNDNAPSLKLIKHVVNDNGGSAVASAWTLSAGAHSITGSETAVEATNQVGTYALSESTVAGYTRTSLTCDDAPSTQVTSVTIGLGQTKTCTFVNDDNAPGLKLIKHVINDNGGTAVASAWTLSAGAHAVTGSETAVEATNQAGTYALSESSLTGYTRTSLTCDDAPSTQVTSVTIGLGQTKTCTFVNDDNAPSLKLIKHVVNDNGGTAVAGAWTLSAGAHSVTGSETAVEATNQTGTYALSESSVTGYTQTSLTCSDAPSTQVTSVTIALGQTKICTFVNDDIAPKLHLRKVVVNNNGGTATVANFTLTADGTGTNDLQGISPVDSGTGLKADTWTLSETTLFGYQNLGWVCSGSASVVTQVTVGIGGEKTCTVTNDDLPGTIIIKKVIKPTGSTTQFSFDANGTGYSDFSISGGQQNSQDLNAGGYTVQEMVPLGWVLTGIGGSTDPNTPYNCTVVGSGGSSGLGDLNTQTATINLKNGDVVTCVFENTGEGVTRTQGFWATHSPLAQIAWFGGTAFGHTFPGVGATAGIGDSLLCGRPLDSLNKLMGAFWSDVSKDSNNQKRSALDQVRMQLLQQLIAAELNASAFGAVPASGSFAAWETAYCGTNQNAIKTAQQQSASFNTAGDSGAFTPGTSADSKNARAIANKAWWDILP